MRWLFEKLGKLINEIVAGVAIALVLSVLTSGWYLIQGNLLNQSLDTWIIPAVGIVILMIALVSGIAIWKKRNQWKHGFSAHVHHHSERIEKIFVGRAGEIELFKQIVSGNRLTTNHNSVDTKILWFHGIGGLGKSWLMEKIMSESFHLNLPAARVSFDKDRYIVDILRSLSGQLIQQRVQLDRFTADLTKYLRIQADLQATALKAGGQLARIITSTVGEIGVPGVSPIAKAIGPESVGQLVDSLRSQMSEEDAELYLEPKGRLTSSFVEDIKKAGAKQRTTLVFDTFEQAGELDSWVCELVDKLTPANVLFAISGRNTPSLHWNDLLPYLQTVELQALDEADAIACLRGHQGENLRQEISVENLKSIYHFSNGLPLALSLSMYVVRQYGMKGFELQSQNVIKNLLQIILREARLKAWDAALEFSSILRSFNEDTLAALTNREAAKTAYTEIQSSFPVVPKGDRKLALHDSIRDWLGQELFARSPATFDEYHRKAAAHYAEQLRNLENEKTSQSWQVATENFLYHKFQCVDPDALELLKTAFEESQLNYPENMPVFLALARESARFVEKYSNWIAYFEARLNPIRSERIVAFRRLIHEPELGLYVRTSLGITLFNIGAVDEAVDILWQNHTQSTATLEEQYSPVDKIVSMTSKRFLAIYLRITGDFSGTCELLEGTTLPRMQVELARAYYFLGRYSEAETMLKNCAVQFKQHSHPVRYSALAYRYLAHIYIHERRMEDARHASNLSYEFASSINDTYLKNLALCNIAFIDRDIASLKSITDQLLEQDTTRYERKSIISKYANQTGILFLEGGDIELARRYFREALKLSQDSSYLVGIIRAELGLIECDTRNGSLENADLQLQDLDRKCVSAGVWDYAARLRFLQSKVKVELAKQAPLSDPARCAELLEEAVQLFANSLIAALTFNRYMLDLSLESIIAFGKTEPAFDGFNLFGRLSEIWKMGKSNGHSLVGIEKSARELEIGDGSPQVFVLDRLETIE